MMYEVKWSNKFKKAYKLAKKRGLNIELLKFVVDELRQGNELDDKFHDHALKGKYKGFRECHIQPDWLLIYLIENDVLVLTLVDTGTHADLFNI